MNYNVLIDIILTGIQKQNQTITEFKWDNKNNCIYPAIPKNTDGVYIMLDRNEEYQGKPRIVRIGKACREIDGLKDRINEHYKSKQRYSVLRKHIGACPSINSNENLISNYIRNHISFVLIKTDKEEWKNVEPALIGMVAKEYMDNNFQARGWLGNTCLNENVKKCKLWNSQHIYSNVPLSVNIAHKFIKV